MFEIYEKKKPDYLNMSAIGCAVLSYFVTIFFAIYLELNEVFLYVGFIVPAFVYNAVINSDHRTRVIEEDE